MPGLDDVLERLVTDHPFRGRLAADPAGALAGYDLSADDRALLAAEVTAGAGTQGSVESRMSKASLAGFLDAAGEVADAFGSPDSPSPVPIGEQHINVESWALGVPPAHGPDLIEEEVGFSYQAIKFQYDEPDTGLPDALGSVESGGTEHQETGPISDVLYSAAGDSGPDGAAVGDSGFAGSGNDRLHDSGATWDDPAALPGTQGKFEALDYPGDYATTGGGPAEPNMMDPGSAKVTSYSLNSMAGDRPTDGQPGPTTPLGEVLPEGTTQPHTLLPGDLLVSNWNVSDDAPLGGDGVDGMVVGAGSGGPPGTDAAGDALPWRFSDVLVSSFQSGASSDGPVGGTGIDVLIGGSTDMGDQSPGGDGVDDVVVGAGSGAGAGTNSGQPIYEPPPEVLLSNYTSGDSGVGTGDGTGDVLVGATGMDDGTAMAEAESVDALAPAPEPAKETADEAAAPVQAKPDAPERAAPAPAQDQTAAVADQTAAAPEPDAAVLPAP